MSAPPRLVAALDFAERSEAVRFAGKINGIVPWVKVGPELFCADGPRVVRELKGMGFSVLLDLKFHDIPNTVHRAVAAACGLRVDMLTLHIAGGERMIRAATDAARRSGHTPLLFGVTILTSTGPGEIFGSGARTPRAFAAVVKRLAIRAESWGMDGVVCSGHEARAVKRATKLRCLVPGIRPALRPDDAALRPPRENPPDDQRRIVSPAEAARFGADYLVLGRPLVAAPDPAQAALNILASIRKAAPAPPTLSRGSHEHA
jgi:orotidine-5'-phosphate decarboxylase